MSEEIPREIFFVLDSSGALIVFEEERASWVGVLGFSSERRALEFIEASRLAAGDIAAVETADAASIAALIASVKRRAARHLILDLDYKTGEYVHVEFEGDALGAAHPRRMQPHQSS